MRALIPALLVVAACGGDESSTPMDKPMSTKAFGGDRPADLRTPTTLTPGKQYPLVVLLHGFGANGFAQSAYFHMQTLTAADSAFYIAPDGTMNSGGQQFWNADPACCDFNNQNPDDVGYLKDLVEDIVAEWPIDESRIYFIGHSNGGFMSYRMACEYAERVAAVASLAGNAASMPSSCAPSEPVSVLHMHGTADSVVPFEYMGYGAEASVTQWATHDGCGTSRSPTFAYDLDTAVSGAETSATATAGCPAGVAVDLWTMTGSSHIPTFNDTISIEILKWLVAHPKS